MRAGRMPQTLRQGPGRVVSFASDVEGKETNMSLRKNSLIRYFVPAIAILGAVIGGSTPSHAYVNQIVIDQTATVNYSPIPWAARSRARRFPTRFIRAGSSAI